jgi:hypothetical protein
MRKARPYLFAALALALGFGLGLRYMASFSHNMEVDLKMRAQEDRIDMAVRALKQLRAGTTNTSEFLEIQLDEAVLALGNLVSNSPKAYGVWNGFAMIEKAKEYRAKYPHSSAQPGLDEWLARTFALIDELRRN